MNEIHRKIVSLNCQQGKKIKFLFSLLSKCMKKVRQKKTLTGEMQTKNCHRLDAGPDI